MNILPTKALYRVLIIGCGNIAGGFDFLRTPKDYPLTHAGAYLKHGGFVLSACLEPNLERLKKFQDRWNINRGVRNFSELNEQNESFDVVSICSPSHLHPEHIELALRLKPKVIFCEKPLTLDEDGGAKQVQLCQAQGVALVVNYNRRWDPVLKRIFQELRVGRWGRIRSVVAHYNKGILNNGSHIIDLLTRLLGRLHPIAVSTSIFDFSSDDPTIAVLMSADDGRIPVYLNPSHAADYSCFELDVQCERGTLCMRDGGLVWYFREVVSSVDFKDYKVLGEFTKVQGGYGETMGFAVDDIYKYITQGIPMAISGKDALDIQCLCLRIRKLAFENM